MRIGCSKLNSDLCYNLYVIDNPACPCGANMEDAKHFFMVCPLQFTNRERLKYIVQQLMPFNVKNLLFGNKNFDLNVNKQVFDAVHQYIKESRRFT